MTSSYGTGKNGQSYFYYRCSRQNRGGKEECEMNPIPAVALESVIRNRIAELGNDPNTVAGIVQNATLESSSMLEACIRKKDVLMRQRTGVEGRIASLVESIAEGGGGDGVRPIRSKISELEENKAQLDLEIAEMETQITLLEHKAVSPESFSGGLKLFEELYDEATPEERKELMRLQIDQLIFDRDEIKLALIGEPMARGMGQHEFSQKGKLVARTGFEPVLPT
ncbi:MAG: zinc ribbon domain-containing protein [Candidatus Latescibacteria bacterium]|nr:zinc ribbon domain-containing protein [Candidatus Latescibacterota bacterium]